MLNTIQKVLGNIPIVFKFGNHDERYDNFLFRKAGELNGLDDYRLDTIISKRVNNIVFVSEKRIVKAGKLNVVHGHEFAQSIMSPVNIARGLYLKAKASSICGHHHQTSEHTESNIDGTLATTWSVGCLSELHPAYMPINKWNHGFCTIDIGKGGAFEVKNYRIKNGVIL